MTLVLSVATPAYSLQVSDRLVSKAGEPFDPLANKNVVLRATDGLLVFGYTGLAFLDGLPTDTWIADRISGGACAEIGGALAYGSFAVGDVGSSLLALIQSLQSASAFRDHGGEICAVGWQWNGKPERALVRNWALSAAAWQTLLERVGGAGAEWQSVEMLLVEAIRSAAEHSPGTIGAHCMSILVRPWMFPNRWSSSCRRAPIRATGWARRWKSPTRPGWWHRMRSTRRPCRWVASAANRGSSPTRWRPRLPRPIKCSRGPFSPSDDRCPEPPPDFLVWIPS